MTEDQVQKLAEVSASMGHITKAVDEIKQRMNDMPTKADLREYVTRGEVASSLNTLTTRVDGIQKELESGSAASWMRRVRDAALTLIALAGAFGVVAAIVRFAAK